VGRRVRRRSRAGPQLAAPRAASAGRRCTTRRVRRSARPRLRGARAFLPRARALVRGPLRRLHGSARVGGLGPRRDPATAPLVDLGEMTRPVREDPYERPRGGTMAPIVDSIEIARSPEDVFAYLDDLARHPEWQDQLVSVEVTTPGRTTVGTRAKETRKAGGREMSSTYEITEHDPPRSFAFKAIDGSVRPVG